MIAFRDFQPEVPGFFPKAGRIVENFAAALAEANVWIAAEEIDIVNVETVGQHESALEIPKIRIWDRTSPPKPDPLREL